MIQGATYLAYVQLFYIRDWLVPSQLLIKSDHLSVPLLIELNIPGGSGQLILASRPTIYIL
jgi:hypothetical protein